MKRKIFPALSILLLICVVFPLDSHFTCRIFQTDLAFAQSGFVLEDFALYSLKETKLYNIGESKGNIGSNGDIDITKGVSGSVIGSLQALDQVKNESEIGIYGDVTAPVIDDNGTLFVSGQVIVSTDLTPFTVTELSISSSGPDLEAPENTVMTIEPGSYGNLKLKKGSTLNLSCGEYYFVKFEAYEFAAINLDVIGDCGIYINIVEKMKIKDDVDMQINGGGPEDVHINFSGTDKIDVEDRAFLQGILTAPAAKVEFDNGSRLEGAVYANSIHLGKGASFRHYTASLDGHPPTADADGHQTVLVDEQVKLDGSGSSDPDGDAITYHWSIVSFPDGSNPALSDPASPTPTFSANLAGVYEIELVVNDGTYTSLRDTATVTAVTEIWDLTDFALYADDKIKVDEIFGGVGSAGANRHIHIEKGPSGTISGDLYVLDQIKNHGEIIIDGNLFTNSIIDDHGGFTVTGMIDEDAGLMPRILPSLSFSAEGPDHQVDGSEVQILEPGSYGRVEVKKGAKLQFSAGSYYLRELKTDDDTVIIFDASAGEVELNVVKKLELGKDAEVQIAGGSTWDVLINYAGKKEVEIEDRAILRGTLVAPKAKVEFEKYSSFEGAVYAKNIYLDTGVYFQFHPNRPPVADTQTIFTDEDTPASITLSGSDPDEDSLTFTVVSQPLYGTLSGTAPDLTYTPSDNFNGVDDFSFTVNDGTVDAAPARVIITVAAVNDDPVAAAQNISLNEDEPTAIVLTAFDVEGDTLAYEIVDHPSHGTLSGAAPDLIYTPVENYHGDDFFSFLVSDGNGGTDKATAYISVNPINDPPVAGAGPDQSVYRGDTVTLDGSGSIDVDGDSLTYQWSFVPPLPSGSSATLPNPTAASPSFLADAAGTYQVQLIVNDGTVDSAADSVAITATIRMVNVPNVIGQLQSDAEAQITAAGLSIATVTFAYSDTIPTDLIISQSPSAGLLVEEGSFVDFVASLGKEPFAPPTVTLTADPAVIALVESTTLTWLSQNATSAHIDNGIGVVSVNDSVVVSPEHTTTYTITATGPGGTAVDTVQVQVLMTAPYFEEVDFGTGFEQQGGGGIVGETVRILNGNVFESRTDLQFASAHSLGLAFAAAYNSRSIQLGDLGYGWTHTYAAMLETDVSLSGKTYLRIIGETGRAAYFLEDSPGLYKGAFAEKTYVEEFSGEYSWHRLNGSVFGFSADGKLSWIEDEKANRIDIGYDVQGYIQTVTDNSTGRELVFNYNADGLLHFITGPITKAVSDGIWVTFGYDADQNLSSVIYADGSGIDYLYDDANDIHNLTEKKNKAGHLIVTWGYDKQDRAKNNTTASGKGVGIEYVSDTSVAVTDAYGTLRAYTIADINGRKRVTAMQGATLAPYSADNVIRWEYDADLNLTEAEYGGGLINHYQDYDSRGNPQTVILAAGTPEERTVAYTYHPFMLSMLLRTEPSVLGSGNKETIWDYDDDYDLIPNENPTGLISRIIEKGFTHDLAGAVVPYEYVTVFTYNSSGQILSIDGPRPGSSDTTKFEYDPASGNLLSLIRPLIGATDFSGYDAAGFVGTVTDVNGQSDDFIHDGRGRLKTVTHRADGSSRSTVFNIAGRPDRKTDEDGIYYDFIWEPTYGRLDRKLDMDDNYIAYAYDAQGNMTEKGKFSSAGTRTSIKRWSYQHPAFPGMLWKEINFDGTYTEYGYDGAGNINSVTDPRTYTTSYEYDPLNRLETVTQPGNIITDYGYDLHGNLKTVTDAKGNTTTFLYDDMGRVVVNTSPDTGITAYAFDEAGNVVQNTDARGITVQYLYDDLNRLTNVNFPDAFENIVNSYDAGLYGKGRRTGMLDQTGSSTFGYDPRGRLTVKTSIIYGVAYTVSRSYTPGERLEEVVYPTGRSIDYSRHPNGKIEGGTTTFNSVTDVLFNNTVFNPFGKASGMSSGSGSTVNNQTSECDCLEIANPGAPMETVYSYDASRNLTSIRAANAPWLDRDYTYDPLNRLANADGAFGSYAFTYDDVGNRLTSTENGQSKTYSYIPGTNRIEAVTAGSQTVSYVDDPNGNIVRIGDRVLKYNQNNRLVRVEENTNVLGEYLYSGMGQRVTKTVEGVETLFHYDFDGKIIGESAPDGTFSKEYLYTSYTPKALVDVASGQIYYYLNDNLGTPQMLVDSTNTIVWEATYEPFGEALINPKSPVENNFRFPGQYYDNETGLHYNWHRYYDPRTGSYLSPDPIGLAGGINLYAYASNNPINRSDPFGLLTSAYYQSHGYSPYDIDYGGAWTSAPRRHNPIHNMLVPALGNRAGDIFTIGVSGGFIVGGGLSLDRVVMPNGQPDWFFTAGGGLTTPGVAFALDRGNIFELDLVGSDCNKMSKADIEGFTLSGNVDIFVVGFEGAIAPFNTNRNETLEYPSPLLTGKGGLRVSGPGANIFGNWTWDIGD